MPSAVVEPQIQSDFFHKGWYRYRSIFALCSSINSDIWNMNVCYCIGNILLRFKLWLGEIVILFEKCGTCKYVIRITWNYVLQLSKWILQSIESNILFCFRPSSSCLRSEFLRNVSLVCRRLSYQLLVVRV